MRKVYPGSILGGFKEVSYSGCPCPFCGQPPIFGKFYCGHVPKTMDHKLPNGDVLHIDNMCRVTRDTARVSTGLPYAASPVPCTASNVPETGTTNGGVCSQSLESELKISKFYRELLSKLLEAANQEREDLKLKLDAHKKLTRIKAYIYKEYKKEYISYYSYNKSIDILCQCQVEVIKEFTEE